MLTAARSEAGEDPASMAEIEREIAWVGVLSGEPTGFSIEHARSSLASAERADDRGLQAAALVSLAGFSFMHGDGLQLELFDRAAQLAGDDRPMFGLHLPLLERGVAVGILSKWADDFETARALLTERLGHYAGLGDESQIPFIQYHLSELECWQGNWARGRDLASEGIKLAGLGDQQTLVIVLALAIATIDALEGSTQAAMDAASDILTKSRDANFISALVQSRALLGFIGLSVDDPAAADAHLNGLTALMDSIEVREPGVIRFQADEIQAAISVGDLERADLLTDQLELRAASLDRPWGKVAGARSRALLLAERGGSEDALEAVDRALVHHERLAVPFELGRTLLVQGIVHRRLKHKRAAKDALDRALGIFERLGSPLWTSKARGELARIGLRPSAPLELTPTEARVAGLAAAGRTNREIASALYLSPKTVDSNLGRVYRKLGVRSRTELARQLPLDGEAIEREHTTPIDAID
jgi:DNA-binding CsgD family transcriptional regulator